MPYSTCTDFETFYQLRQANIYHSTTEALLSMNYYITNIHILYLKNKYKWKYILKTHYLFFGGPRGTWTPDLQIMSLLLWPTELCNLYILVYANAYPISFKRGETGSSVKPTSYPVRFGWFLIWARHTHLPSSQRPASCRWVGAPL